MSKLHAFRILLSEKSFQGDTDHWTLRGKNANNVYLDPHQSKKQNKNAGFTECAKRTQTATKSPPGPCFWLVRSRSHKYLPSANYG